MRHYESCTNTWPKKVYKFRKIKVYWKSDDYKKTFKNLVCFYTKKYRSQPSGFERYFSDLFFW